MLRSRMLRCMLAVDADAANFVMAPSGVTQVSPGNFRSTIVVPTNPTAKW